MSKTKRNERKVRSQSANAEVAAATETIAASTSSATALKADPNHEAECPGQTQCHPGQERSADDFNMAVRELAYYKWEAAGFPEGDGLDFWLKAEREIRAAQPAETPARE